MSNLPQLVSLVCAGILIVLLARQATGKRKLDPLEWALIVLALSGGWVAFNLGVLGAWRSPVSGCLIGFGSALLLASYADTDSPALLAPALLLTVGFVSFFALPQWSDESFALACLTGSAGAAGWLALRQRSLAAGLFTLVAALAWAASMLGRELAPNEARGSVENILAVALVGILAGEGLTALTKGSKVPWPRWATALLFGVMAFFVVVRNTEFPDLPLVVAGTALVAIALHAVSRKDEDSLANLLVGGLVWLGVATMAFSFGRGYGLALAGLVGVIASWIAGERRLIAWLSPLVALCIYRLARLLFPDASRAFDIGQHYALVGMMLGLVLPLILAEWGRALANRKSLAGSIAAVLAGASTLSGLSAAVNFLGAKGSSGLAIGLLVSPLVSALRGQPPKTALSNAVGLACWVVVSIGVFATQDDLARPDKVKLVLTVGSIVAAMAVAAVMVGRPKKETVTT